MQWYYVNAEGQSVGPLSDNDFRAAIFRGAVSRQTLVWHAGLKEWTPYGRIPPEAAPGGKPPLRLATPAHPAPCARCGRTFDATEMTEIEGALVCDECRPVVQQAAQAAVFAPRYAGFWIRFLAKIFDHILLSLLLGILAAVMLVGAGLRGPAPALRRLFAFCVLAPALAALYEVFFVGRFGATPGKMALGLRIVRSDGRRVGYGRALGRWAAEILSRMIFHLGYVIAAFDRQKRALHDHLCDTRVIRT